MWSRLAAGLSACNVVPRMVTVVGGKVRRGNYVFLAWKGDHSPRHVHVYSGGRLVVKWNLEDGVAMKGRITTRVRS
jgi:hypothetical protein